VGLTALAAARPETNPIRAGAAEGHILTWPSDHEPYWQTLASFLPIIRGTADEFSSNNQTKRSTQMIKKFFRDETGLELSEYAVAAALVAIAVVGAFTALGGAIGVRITELGDTIAN